MKAVYPPIDQWVVSQRVLNATLECVRPAGRNGRESGVLWLGTRASTAQIFAIAFPRGPGVEERPGRWHLSPEVFGSATRWAALRKLCLLGIAHIHPNGIPPRPSSTDEERGVRIPGILEVIIGNGGEDSDHRDWGWHVFEEDIYRPLSFHEVEQRIRIQESGVFAGCSANAVRYEDWEDAL